uniref:RNA helicase n=1 Tax=Rhodnius prolixus TaxID=13249 RepID=T1IA87_RHOPR
MLSWDLKAAEQDVPRKLSSPLDRRRNSSSPNLPDDSWLMQKIANTLVITKTGEDIEKLRRNPFSPFHSIKSFEALNLITQINGKQTYYDAINIWILVERPQNMIAQSQSGTGKTAAFVLAMLSRVDSSRPYPQVVCLAPTYELAIQIGEVAAKIGQFCEGITFKFAVRGEYGNGIDIEDVTIAVNFDLPLDARRKTDCQTYLHRIGRTGRFGNNGLAISFVSSQEANDNIPQIRDRFGSEIIAILSE